MNYYNLISMMPKAVAYDADAQAFITATGISGTNASAINTLVIDLKAASIWTKMKAIYPIVGGTATTHKFNLKNPLDTNAAFRLAFSGGWTHSSNGMLPNGTNTYAETYLIPTTSLTLYNTHLSYYCRTNLFEISKIEMGSYSGTGNNIFALSFGRVTNSALSIQYDQGTATNYAISTTANNSQGFWMGNRTSNVGSTHKLWRNGITIASATTTGGAMLANTIWIGAINNSGTPLYYTTKECAFASIGDGLTDAEALSFYNAVQTYQTTLGRQV